MAIQWDPQQNKFIVIPDSAGGTQPTATPPPPVTTQQSEGGVVWDPKQNRYVASGSAQPPKSTDAHDLGAWLGNLFKRSDNQSISPRDIISDVASGLKTGGEKLLSTLLTPGPLSPAQDQQKQAQERLRGMASTEEQSRQGQSPAEKFISGAAEFAPAAAATGPLGLGGGLLAGAAEFAIQSQLIYNPNDHKDGSELQGRLGDVVDSAISYGLFKGAGKALTTLAKPVLNTMEKSAQNLIDPFLQKMKTDFIRAAYPGIQESLDELVGGKTNTIEDIIKGAPMTDEARAFFASPTWSEIAKKYGTDPAKYPETVLQDLGKAPEEGATPINLREDLAPKPQPQATEIPVPSDVKSNFINDAGQMVASIADSVAHFQAKDVPGMVKDLSDQIDFYKTQGLKVDAEPEDFIKLIYDTANHQRAVEDNFREVAALDIKNRLVDTLKKSDVYDSLAALKRVLPLLKSDDADKLASSFDKAAKKKGLMSHDVIMENLQRIGINVTDPADLMKFAKGLPTAKELSAKPTPPPVFDLEKKLSDVFKVTTIPQKDAISQWANSAIVDGTGKSVHTITSSTIEDVLDHEEPATEQILARAREIDIDKAQKIYDNLVNRSKPSVKALDAIKEDILNPVKTFKEVVQRLQPEFFTPNESKNIIQSEYQRIPGNFLDFLRQKTGYMDLTFNGMEKFFNKFSEVERTGFLVFAQSIDKPAIREEIPTGQLVADLLAGKEKSQTTKDLEALFIKNTPEVLRDPEIVGALRDGFDQVFGLISTLPKRWQVNYVDNYFRTIWKKSDSTQIDQLTKRFSSIITSTGFTKEKWWDTIVEGIQAGHGLEVTNPVAMLKNELESVLTLKSIANIEEKLLSLNDLNQAMGINFKYIAPSESAPKEFVDSGIKGLEQYKFDPGTAELINGLYSPGTIKNTMLGKSIYNLALFQRGIQLLVPTYHFLVITALSLHDTKGLSPINLLNPVNRTIQFMGAKDAFEKGMGTEIEKMYEEYTKVGGETMQRNRSYEQEGSTALIQGAVTAFNKVGEKAGFLEPMVKSAGGLVQIPGRIQSAIFDNYIPAQKFGSYVMWNRWWEKKLGRSLNEEEKRTLVMKLQNPYGEMNESLYGRSRTVQQGLRLLFRAPGFREGNFRFMFDTLNFKNPMNKMERTMLVNGLAATFGLATLGTLAMTGKLPQLEIKREEDSYDLFTIHTGQEYAKGKELVIDLPRIFNLKDYYRTLGNLVTGNPQEAFKQGGQVVGSALAPEVSQSASVIDMLEGKPVTDFKGQPIDAKTAILQNNEPIALSSAQNVKGNYGGTVLEQAMAAGGVPFTSTQQTKDAGEIGSQLYNLVQTRNTAHSKWKKASDPAVKTTLDKQVKDYDKQIGQLSEQLQGITGDNIGLINKKYRIPKESRPFQKPDGPNILQNLLGL